MKDKEKALIIVESPAKIKTLKKFLGSNYSFMASMGHIRDLPVKGFGIDIENNFEPTYEIMPDKKKVCDDIKKAAKGCSIVYLSPDPDREGEAIAWHISNILPKNIEFKRVSFNAITKEAVQTALKNPRDIDTALVNAQQARRLLDRIVGYKISPILSRKLHQRSGISAGRVQSVALKLVVDREKEIDSFVPVEYWTISADMQDHTNKTKFHATLNSVDGLKWEKEKSEKKDTFTIPNEETAKNIKAKIEKSSFFIESVDKKEKKRNPVPPFITSTLQQEASRHFRFSATKTMSVAQSLYEGVSLGSGEHEGLITYMRTDSTRTAPEGLAEVRSVIKHDFGPEYLPPKANTYETKKSAQDAHECIRPTSLERTPESLKPHLTHDQYQLYGLIWKRFVASQMMPAIYDTVSVLINSDNKITFKATGSTIKFKGFLSLYEEKFDDDNKDPLAMELPNLIINDPVDILKIKNTQSFTAPPARFTEASLVKELEKSGIGRPSTYASIMQKIQSRDYTIKEQQRLKPTELGKVISQFLDMNFSGITNTKFTAVLEDELELIACNNKNWKELLKDFWENFSPLVTSVEQDAQIPREETELSCPKCNNSKLFKIWSKSKYFYGCGNYPECDYTSSPEEMAFNKEDYDPNFNWDSKCPLCSKDMTIRYGRFGAFLGCGNYPKCKGLINIPKVNEVIDESDKIKCPATGCPGHILKKTSRFNKPFYSCSCFPQCDVIANSLELVDKKYANRPQTAYVAKKTTRGLKTPNEALAEVIGKDPVSNGEAMKKIWIYIKEKNLQNPANKREIIPDTNLEVVFGSKDAVNMFSLAGIINKNFK